YKLDKESAVKINVFNSTGQLVYSLDDGMKTKGSHYTDFNATGLKNGIYFYSICINGQITDSKKMTIMK
ncbi:MAG: gliding motility-associated C-terminal domain-containing protein, partial [Bacteroidales bacterium]|nr:gliding motility-associated C-terminal domain-containing protein [Bacteroidales bacterium]